MAIVGKVVKHTITFFAKKAGIKDVMGLIDTAKSVNSFIKQAEKKGYLNQGLTTAQAKATTITAQQFGAIANRYRSDRNVNYILDNIVQTDDPEVYDEIREALLKFSRQFGAKDGTFATTYDNIYTQIEESDAENRKRGFPGLTKSEITSAALRNTAYKVAPTKPGVLDKVATKTASRAKSTAKRAGRSIIR